MSSDKGLYACRLYFGRVPENAIPIDNLFIKQMEKFDYVIDEAVGFIVEELIKKGKGISFHTINPLILNFMFDKDACELVWMIDEEGNHISMGNDAHMLKKLGFMGPGDVCCDDARSFKSWPVTPQNE